MKTLKQLLQEKGFIKYPYEKADQPQIIINTVVEWLTQKRQEYIISSKDSAIHKRICIDQLIEELNSPV